jgi:transcriptional regulator with XRE-family HTH domain
MGTPHRGSPHRWESLSTRGLTGPLSAAVDDLPFLVVDNRSEIREFLASRRARITPEQAGLPVFGGTRRVVGLRREEVAMLAGVSADYYTRLERGNLKGVSDTVLEALARGLRLDEAERAHLFDLARAAGPPSSRPRRRSSETVRASVQRILDAMTGAPAFAQNGRLDVLAANPLGRALYSPMFADPVRPANLARFVFSNPRSREFYADWDRVAHDTVAILRSEAGRDPYERGLSDLVGELSTRGDEFRTRWAAHDVRIHRAGIKHVHHPVVGDLELTFEMMELAADPGLSIVTYTAAPGTRSEEALSLLGSWAATLDRDERASSTDDVRRP